MSNVEKEKGKTVSTGGEEDKEDKFAEACFPSTPRFDREVMVRRCANLVKLPTPRSGRLKQLLFDSEACTICAVVDSKKLYSGEDR